MARTSSVGAVNSNPSGYTYLLMIVAIAVMGISVEVLVTFNSRLTKVSREQELLFRGLGYRKAIGSYYRAGGANPEYPKRLEHLLIDPRDPNRKHIRRLYADPINEKGEWEIIPSVDGGIMGVNSQGTGKPLKQANFPPGLETFEGAESYQDWKFVFETIGKKKKGS